MAETMRAYIRHGPDALRYEEIPRPHAGPGEAVLRMTLTTVCGSDIHAMHMPLPRAVRRQGLVMGHEITGVIDELGDNVEGFAVGERVLVSCLTPCGRCTTCLSGDWSACSHPDGGLQYGFRRHGCQADYLLVPHAQTNLCHIPDAVSDEQALFAGDIMSTGFAVSERAGLSYGDTIAIFAQGPLGLCATAGARLRGAGLVITVESVPERIAMSRALGADIIINPEDTDPVAAIMRLTEKRGVDIAVDAVGRQEVFAKTMQVVRHGGTVSSLGVYGGLQELTMPMTPTFYHRKYITTLCPSGSERLRKLLLMIQYGKVDLTPLWTHHMRLDDIAEAYVLFQERRDGVLKIAITP